MSFAVGIAAGLVVLLVLAAVAWYSRRDARLRRGAIADARARVAERASRQDFPHRYVGPTKRYREHGTLAHETPCRIAGHKPSNVVRIVTPGGDRWLVRDSHVVARERAL